MTPQTTLEAVRELSERAMFRPSPTRLRLTKPEEQRPGPRRAVMTYEELHPPRIGTEAGRASGQQSRKPRVEHVTRTAMEKDFMRSAIEKTEAVIVRLPLVTPAAA
jgi:hypothetical protein